MPQQTPLQKHREREAWATPHQYATTMLVLFVDTYGTEGLAWDNRTIKMEIEDDFDVELPQGNFDRLMVAKSLLTTDDFYHSLPDFIQWCNILSGDTYDPRVWDPADAGECAWGITEALLIDQPEDDNPFQQEVVAYVGAMLDAEGIITPPDVLQIAANMRGRQAEGLGDFSDDPDMFSAVYDFETGKTEAINAYVKQSLITLSKQLDTLPLQTGSTKNVVQQMLRTLS